MSSAIIDPTTGSRAAEANGADTRALEERLTPEFQNSLADHPLWPDFLAELKANRLADKAAAEVEWGEAAAAEEAAAAK